MSATPDADGFRWSPAHIPNLISLGRIALVWPVAQSLLHGRQGLALLLIIVAGISDGLDGFLAKRFDWRSRLGGILDPLADKLLLVTSFLILTYLGEVPVWLAAVVISRDVVIVAGGIVFEWLIGPVQPEPSRASKANTGAQLLYLLATIGAAGFDWPAGGAVLSLGALVLVTSVVSGLDYVLRWSAKARRRSSR